MTVRTIMMRRSEDIDVDGKKTHHFGIFLFDAPFRILAAAAENEYRFHADMKKDPKVVLKST